jgi:hypothetical protein
LKISKLLFLVLAAGIFSAAAWSDPIDPTVKIRRDDPPPGVIPIQGTSPTFSFSQFGLSSGTDAFFLQNQTAGVIYQVTLLLNGFDVSALSPLSFDCAGDQSTGGIFNSCAFSYDSSTQVSTLIFSGVTPPTTTGITPGTGGGGDCCCFSSGEIVELDVTGIPVGDLVEYGAKGSASVPEPVSSVLVLAGLAGLAGFRKRFTASKA